MAKLFFVVLAALCAFQELTAEPSFISDITGAINDQSYQAAKQYIAKVGVMYRGLVQKARDDISNVDLRFTQKLNDSTDALEADLNKIVDKSVANANAGNVDISDCIKAGKENISKIVDQAKSQVNDLNAEEKKKLQPVVDQVNTASQLIESLATEGDSCKTALCYSELVMKAHSKFIALQIPTAEVRLKVIEAETNAEAFFKLLNIRQSALAAGKQVSDATDQCAKSKASA